MSESKAQFFDLKFVDVDYPYVSMAVNEKKEEKKEVRPDDSGILVKVVSFVAIFAFWYYVPLSVPSVNIYKSVSTGEIIKVETEQGVVTKQDAIKEVLSKWGDQYVFYVK